MATYLARDAAEPAEYPADGLPEVALLGRSNAGKSSMLNALVGRRRLAHTSSTPGKTRRVHFYCVQDALYLVDLPGYGYAAASREERRAWRPLVERYLGSGRSELRGALLLMDARRAVSEAECDLVSWLAGRGVPVVAVLSKADKLAPRLRGRVLAEVRGALDLGSSEVLLASSRTGWGMASVVACVHAWSGIELLRADGTRF